MAWVVLLNPLATTGTMRYTLAHEARHMWQWATGVASIALRGTQVVQQWHGVPVPDCTPYPEQPWERDACAYADRVLAIWGE